MEGVAAPAQLFADPLLRPMLPACSQLRSITWKCLWNSGQMLPRALRCFNMFRQSFICSIFGALFGSGSTLGCSVGHWSCSSGNAAAGLPGFGAERRSREVTRNVEQC